ncbi:MAG: hypothetical protein F6K19_46545 [Cyanothece sp. SIO1E1]|nr:hypothetical protein [Cyanothece sp. SIO1E1]
MQDDLQQLVAKCTQTLTDIQTLLSDLHQHPCTLAIPEHWEIKAPKFRPQLVVVCARKHGKSFSRWSFSIPHYCHNQDYQPHIEYIRGNWMCCLVLADNSHVVLNCESAEEGERALASIKPLINPNLLLGSRETFTRSNRQIKNDLVIGTYASFFSTGDKTTAPDWSVKL